jgi:hypothetical protein
VLQEHKLCAHPFLEIYDGAYIHFMAPLSRQADFYVPEAKTNENPHSALDSTLDSSLNISQSELSCSLVDSTFNESSCLPSGDTKLAADVTKSPGEQGEDEDSSSSFEEVKMSETDPKSDKFD